MPGHFDNRMIEAVNKALEKVISNPNEKGAGFATEGEFYKIFKKHDFYDVADTNNRLTEEQRAQVPLHAQYRYSNFANAIAEMLQFFFIDEDIGILNQLDDIILKLDVNATTANDKTNSIAQSMQISALTPVIPGIPNIASIGTTNTIMQIKEYLTGFAMGVNPWNPDLLSPSFSGIGMPDINIGVLGNLQLPGFFTPSWDFLYKFEITKDRFYHTGQGGLKIGANIDVSEYNEINLKKIFGVIVADSKITVSGNLKGGVQGKDFEIITKASNLADDPAVANPFDIITIVEKEKPRSLKNPKGTPAVYANNDIAYDDIREFRINEDQKRSSFYELVQLKLWNVIKNRNNWAHGHWGALTNNAMPSYMRNAICSYVWSVGLALEPGKSEEAALISYLVTTGLYYYIGWQYPVRLAAVPEVDKAIINDVLRGPSNDPLPPGDITVDGLPKDIKIAKRYWEWAADFIIRFTNSAAGEELGIAMRKRRVAEANLIYEGLGKPMITFGDDGISKIMPIYHMEEGLRDRKFTNLLDVVSSPYKFYRYSNTGGAGGDPDLGTPEPIAKLKFASPKRDKTPLDALSNGAGESIINTIRYLLDKSFVREATVTRTSSLPHAQATAMYNNLNNGKYIRYAPPGRKVTNVYIEEKKKLGLGSNVLNGQRIPDNERANVIAKMTEKINSVGPANVSRHCGDLNLITAIDIAPSSVKFHKNVFTSSNDKTSTEVGHGHLINTFYKATKTSDTDESLLSRFLFPHKYAVYALRTSTDDPAYHIELTLPANFTASENNALPDVAFSFKTESFKTAEGREAPFKMDSILNKRYAGPKEENVIDKLKKELGITT